MIDLSKDSLKFLERYTVREECYALKMASGIWSPKMTDWRDVIEDYLYVSRKRANNKWAIFRLSKMNILQDVMSNVQAMDVYGERKKQLTQDVEEGKASKDDFEAEKEHIESEFYSFDVINKALREIMDGLVWKYFDYNRTILHMLASKAPIETVRVDQGTVNALYEFGDVSTDMDSVAAIFNDITNFLRVGDVTKINRMEA